MQADDKRLKALNPAQFQWSLEQMANNQVAPRSLRAAQYRMMLEVSATLPDWTAQASNDQVVSAINDRRLLEGAKRFAGTPGALVLTGPTGAGKLPAAVYAARWWAYETLTKQWIQARRDFVAGGGFSFQQPPDLVSTARSAVKFITAFKLMDSRRLHRLGDGDSPDMNEARTVPLLVLDDLGNEGTAGVDMAPTLDMLGERYKRRRPFIITSGWKPSHIREHYGFHFYRRLTEVNGGPGCVWVDLFGEARDVA